MALDVGTSPGIETAAATASGRVRPLLELCIGYGLILATIWTPRPLQKWLYLAAVVWILVTTGVSFPGCAVVGFRRGGFIRSLRGAVPAPGVCAVRVGF